MPPDDRGHPRQGAGLPPSLTACIVATIAFSVYASTLLPGVDLGDTGGFQAAVLWPETSARQAYPLYYGLARPFVLAVSADNPARGLNLFSALCGALAAGLATYFAALMTRGVVAGASAGLLLAFSHTFWSQSIIAEVYTLHLALIGCCLLALHAYQQRPTKGRLVLFFAVYAVAFGNHLSMILLILPFASFLVAVHPRRRELVRARTITLALGVAAAAAMLYAPGFLFVWTNIDAPPAWGDRLATFWFDVTKADWRGTMMLGVDRSEVSDRVAMWLWDARLQFGTAGLVFAMIGIARLWVRSRPWAMVITTAYAINTVFTVTYNVGDPHVFFLPGHLLTALAIAAAAAGGPPVARRHTVGIRHWTTVAIGVGLLAYAGWRARDTWPSVDRHADRRPDALVARLTSGVDDANSILLSDMNWQAENALLYSARYERKRVAWRRLGEVLPHMPLLVRDNHTLGRDIVLVGNAPARVAASYGPLFPLVFDQTPSPTLADRAAQIPRGTPYVLTLLDPTPEERLDVADLDAAITTLAGGDAPKRTAARFQVWAGIAGEERPFYQESDRPFRKDFSLLGDSFSIRMESWLPFDTFRRAGFGHVLHGRESILTVERGVSLAWLAGTGVRHAYAAGLYATRPRLRIPAALPQQVAYRSGAILE